MDPHIRWLRRRILHSLPRSVGGVFGLGSTLSFAVLLIVTDGSPLNLVPIALIGGQIVAALCVSWAVVSNPLSYRYLRGQTAATRSFRAIEPDHVDEELIERLALHRLSPLATIWDDTAAPVPAFDLFQTPKQTVTLAFSRMTNTASAYSRLDDGRILLTDSVLTVPHRSLAVNRAGGDDANSVLTSHRKALETFKEQGSNVRADDGSLFLEALMIEHDAYGALGPIVGTFFNLSSEPTPHRFLMTLEPDELLQLARDETVAPEAAPAWAR